MKVDIDTSDKLYADAWLGFKGTDWKNEINVRDFIQHNYTPYEGDESFLAEATPATTELWEKVMEGIRIENATHAPLDFDTNIATTITAHDAGYIDQPLEKIVGLQTDAPLKRALHPFGGINMIRSSFHAYGREMDSEFEYIFTDLRKTHNQGVFDVYSPDMLRCRKSGVLTGLPDGYGRGRIIGDYRRVALYGISYLVRERELQFADLQSRLEKGEDLEATIRLREELAEHRRALLQIQEEWKQETPRPVLIHGVTGSGKTQIYMKLIQQTVNEGKQVIVLIPEIALTYQTVRRFYGWFGDKVSVLNSRLSQGERYDQFKRAKRGEIQIMVGPRSALFTPFSRLGLIIIDEEHEQTYKSENSPRYHARETAEYRAQMENARLVMGSATPSLEAYTKAKDGEYRLVKLEARYEDRPLPEVTVVDLREELKNGNRSILSRSLKTAVERRLERGEQSVLFLNRRGYAGFVSCRSCGEALKCPHCDVALTEHNNGKLVCHYCGYEQPRVEKCPMCGSPYIGGFKAGTQQIEQVLRKTFPKARVLRMDYDTTRTKGSYEKILSSFAEHKADILVGTQMIVKGHDFPDVTLVGAIAADLSLNAADYRCAERTFQLLTQAVGRSGRGRKAGEAIIQSYHPDHYSIQAAAKQDYEAFYQEEMAYRMLMDYPPAAHMLSVLASGEDEKLLEQGMDYLAKFVERISGKYRVHVIGPAYASVGKVNDIYRKVLYLKHKDERVLQDIKNKTEKYIEVNSGFRKLYIQFDYT